MGDSFIIDVAVRAMWVKAMGMEGWSGLVV